jgi:hypothetical protein
VLGSMGPGGEAVADQAPVLTPSFLQCPTHVQPSLGGNAKTAIIAAMTPAGVHVEVGVLASAVPETGQVQNDMACWPWKCGTSCEAESTNGCHGVCRRATLRCALHAVPSGLSTMQWSMR